MTYHRTQGRFSGRVCGPGKGACYRLEAGYSLGDASMGTGPQVTGHPVLALIAQLNRFAGRTLTPPGCPNARTYVRSAFPMDPSLTDAAATAAAVILYDRYNCVSLGVYDGKKAAWASSGLSGDSRTFVLAHITEIVATIAQFGDMLGLPPADYGITKSDPLFKRKWSTTEITLAVAGGALVLATLLTRKR